MWYVNLKKKKKLISNPITDKFGDQSHRSLMRRIIEVGEISNWYVKVEDIFHLTKQKQVKEI